MRLGCLVFVLPKHFIIMTPKQVLATIYNDELAQNICRLWSRWQDEHGYEDFKDYEQAMLEQVRKALPDEDVSLVRGT